MTPSEVPLARSDKPFRFFENREKYLLFATTCGEKWAISQRIGEELKRLSPKPPALRLLDAGCGEGTVLVNVLRQLHGLFPHVPILSVGKEISLEDLRLTLDKLPDRFSEHPQSVVVMTNIHYHEIPSFRLTNQNRPNHWHTVALEGTCAHEFEVQIHHLKQRLSQMWHVTPSVKSGNPIYDQPTMLVLYRRDQEFNLHSIIPTASTNPPRYDLVIAAQPYRARSSADIKVKQVLEPLAQALVVGGRLIIIQSTGQDPGMELIQRVWPGEMPFQTPAPILINALKSALTKHGPQRRYYFDSDTQPSLRYHMHLMPSEISETIGSSTLLAAWNAATYVAQIDDRRITEAMSGNAYLAITKEILEHNGGIWFADESFVLVRSG